MFRDALVFGVLFLFLMCTLEARAEPIFDDFEDGIINPALWTVGGSNQIGFGGIGSWSIQEVIASDGYLEARIQGPATGNTYGQDAWVRTNYDYNDGCNHIVNFRWGAHVNAYHVDAYNISITNGSDPAAYNNPYGPMWHTDNANNTRLYWTISDLGLPPPNNQGQQDLPPTDWSIWIDAAGETATLYQGPNLTGTALPTMPLAAGSPWYLRFYQMDATSAGFPGTDNYLFLYSYSSAVSAPGICGCGMDDTIGFVGFLPQGQRTLNPLRHRDFRSLATTLDSGMNLHSPVPQPDRLHFLQETAEDDTAPNCPCCPIVPFMRAGPASCPRSAAPTRSAAALPTPCGPSSWAARSR